MRPTQINIVGKSKRIFNTLDLRGSGRYGDLIHRIEAGAIIQLSDKVEKAEDLNNLIQYLVRSGIPRSDVRIKYPNQAATEMLREKISSNLRESGLTFGADVAEHDAGLRRYFITTDAYTLIQTGQRHLVVGPKGSGKSAILRELSKTIGHCLVITPEHYATDVLESLKKSPVGTDLTAYVTTWKYTLLIEIFRQLIKTGEGDSAALGEIRKYLVAHNHLSGDLSLFERFMAYLRRISTIRGKIGPTGAELGLDTTKELEKLFKMDELLALIPALRRALRRKTFTVFIDELDQSWNNSETANRFLVSLLTAAIQLRGIDENLHVIVFLRSEIFDLLKPTIAQLDKLRSDIEQIQWSSRELKNLIVSRAFDSIGINPDRTGADSALSVLFPGVVPGCNAPLFDYVLSRTSHRPREVIQFSNLILKVARQLDAASIIPDAVLRAEEEFSAWKLEYVVSENLFIYPRLDALFDRFRGQKKKWSQNELDSFLTEVLLNMDEDNDAPPWLREILEPSKLLEVLYQLEVFGIERPGVPTPDGREWEGYDFAFSRPKARPEQSPSFLFHPGLWKTLELI